MDTSTFTPTDPIPQTPHHLHTTHRRRRETVPDLHLTYRDRHWAEMLAQDRGILRQSPPQIPSRALDSGAPTVARLGVRDVVRPRRTQGIVRRGIRLRRPTGGPLDHQLEIQRPLWPDHKAREMRGQAPTREALRQSGRAGRARIPTIDGPDLPPDGRAQGG